MSIIFIDDGKEDLILVTNEIKSDEEIVGEALATLERLLGIESDTICYSTIEALWDIPPKLMKLLIEKDWEDEIQSKR